MALNSPTSASDDRYGTVLAFLKEAFAGPPIDVTELEVNARAAKLLGERQSITHSKLFKRAKKALGIQSVRVGFGATGEWFWGFPQDPGSDCAHTGHLSSNAVKPEQVSRLEPRQSGIGVPRQWVDGIASLHRQHAPADVPPHRWRLLIDDCERFLDPKAMWAPEAAAKGWDAAALFGCAPTQPLAHMQVAGLIWALRGRRIVRLYPDCASIEDSADGSRYVFNRRVTYGAPIALPWTLR